MNVNKVYEEDKDLSRSYTFDEWKKGYSSYVYSVDKEELEMEGYESTYTFMYNYLKEVGWTYEERHWNHPFRNCKYSKIHLAYQSQRLWEKTEGDLSYEES